MNGSRSLLYSSWRPASKAWKRDQRGRSRPRLAGSLQLLCTLRSLCADKHPFPTHPRRAGSDAFRVGDLLPARKEVLKSIDPVDAAARRRGRAGAEPLGSQLGAIGASKRCSCGSRSRRHSLLHAPFSAINQRLQRSALIPEIKPSV